MNILNSIKKLEESLSLIGPATEIQLLNVSEDQRGVLQCIIRQARLVVAASYEDQTNLRTTHTISTIHSDLARVAELDKEIMGKLREFEAHSGTTIIDGISYLLSRIILRLERLEKR